MGVEPYVNGRPVSTVGAWGDLQYSERFDGGSWEASWVMEVRRGWHHPAIRRGADVELRLGGLVVWAGILAEPDRDSWQMTATGLVREGERFSARAADGTPGRYITSSTVNAIGNGLPWDYREVSLPAHANPVQSEESDGLNVVSAIWSAAAAASGMFWGVGSDRIPYIRTRPTQPSWRIAPSVGVLGQGDDEFATHLVGRYRSMAGVLETTTRGDSGAPGTPSDRWGRSERPVDLTPRKRISATRANEILDGMLTKIGPRPGYTTGLTLGPGEITTMGGSLAHLPTIRAGQMVRLDGVVDEATGRPHHDIVIGEIRHDPAARTVYIEPLGLAARNLAAVLEGVGSTPLVG